MTTLSWLDPGPDALRLAGLVLVQITAIVGLAWVLAARRSAAVRDALWRTALVGVVLGPTALVVLHWAGLTLGVVRVPEPTDGPPRAVAVEGGMLVRVPTALREMRPVERPPTTIEDNAGGPTQGVARPTVRTNRDNDGARITWSPALRAALLVWGMGTVVGLAWLACGLRAVARLRRGSRPVADARIEALLDDVARDLGLRQVPDLLVTERLAGPVAVGIVRPAILLPGHLLDGDADRLRDILIHEAAHLLRRDPLTGLFQRLAVAAFWPHPLIHLLDRALSRAREETCDNYVLRTGGRARYARTLLDLAESIGAAPRALAAAGLLPARWRLADRVAGLLDERRDLMVCVDRRTAGGLAAVVVLIAGPFAVLGLDRTEAQTPAPALTVQSEAAPDPAPAPDDRPIAPEEIAGLVVDAEGRPLAGVTADAYSWFPGHETTTDAAGRFRLRVFTMPGQDPREGAEMRFTKDGYGPKTFDEVTGGTADLRVVMDNTTYFEGTVTAPDGSPVPGATVRGSNPMLRNGREVGRRWTATETDEAGRYRLYVEPAGFDISVRVPGAGVARFQGRRIEPGQAVALDIPLEKGVDFRAQVVDSLTGAPIEGLRLYRWLRMKEADIDGRSGPDGIIRLDDLPPGPIRFMVEVPGYARWWSEEAASEWSRRKIDRSDPIYGPWQRNFDDLDFNLAVGMGPVTIVAEQGVTVRGRVLDPDGRPVAGATVAPALTGSGNSLTGDTRFSVETGEDGTYEVLLPTSGERDYNLIAHDGGLFEWRTWANGVTEPFRARPGEVLEGLDITLTRPATAKGRVVDAAGNPVADREVRASAADARENRYYDPTTRTDAAGRFELKFIRPGEQHVQAAPFWLFARYAPAGTSRTVTLEPGEVVEGIELTAQPLR